MDILTVEPGFLRAGANWTWSRSLSDYPAPTWTLKYWLKNALNHVEITAIASGSDHLVAVAPATTAVYAAGDYDWTATVESGVEPDIARWQIGQGRLSILPRVDTTGVLDGRSTARKILEQLESAYLTYSASAQGTVQSYTIGDRSMTFQTTAEFVQQIEYWRGQVRREEEIESVAKGLGNPRRLYTRFS